MTQTTYTVKLIFDSKYEKEMHGLFDVGRIGEILKHYREENGLWFLDINRTDGVEVQGSTVMEVEENEVCDRCEKEFSVDEIVWDEDGNNSYCSTDCEEEAARDKAADRAEQCMEAGS